MLSEMGRCAIKHKEDDMYSAILTGRYSTNFNSTNFNTEAEAMKTDSV